MARTLNGNWTGAAAHGRDELDQVSLDPNDQDKRIIVLKRELKKILSEEEWKEAYIHRPLNGDLQEQYFLELLEKTTSQISE